MSLIPEFGRESSVAPGSPNLSGVVTIVGTQGTMVLDTSNDSTPTIKVTTSPYQLLLASEAGGSVYVGVSAQPNYTPAALYIRPTGSLAALTIENVAGSAELYRIDNTGAHIVGAASVPAAGDNSTKLTTTGWTHKRIAATPSIVTFCGGL